MSKIQLTLTGLACVYVLTFSGGFLQAAPLNFLNFILFALLFAGGVVLVIQTRKSNATGAALWSLMLTSASTTLLFLFFALYEGARQMGYAAFSARLEAFLYLLTLLFWALVIASLVQTRKSKGIT